MGLRGAKGPWGEGAHYLTDPDVVHKVLLWEVEGY